VICSGVQGDTRRYRTFHLHQQLRLAGVDCQLAHITDPDFPDVLSNADLGIFHRVSLDGYARKLLDSYQARGGLAVADTDDMVFDLRSFEWIDSPDFEDAVRARQYRAEMLLQRSMLERCEAVLTSTAFLAQQAAALGKNSLVLRNAFSLEMLASSENARKNTIRQSERVVIGYASGTHTHNKDLAQIARPLQAVLRRFPHAELWMIGPMDIPVELREVGDRVKRLAFVPWRQLPGLLARLDINLAPLVETNPFNQSKSEIKYMEAALVGVPTIASRTDAYVFAIQSLSNGMLASTEAEWEDCLVRLVESEYLRLALGTAAFERVRSAYHPVVRSEECVGVINSIFQQTRGHPLWTDADLQGQAQARQSAVKAPERYWLPARLENHPNLADRAWYMLRHRGVFPLFAMLWIYFRRLFSPLIPFHKRQKP
jgi:glycosyltransferase involved in cell wall biosynthesis